MRKTYVSFTAEPTDLAVIDAIAARHHVSRSHVIRRAIARLADEARVQREFDLFNEARPPGAEGGGGGGASLD